MLQYHISCCLVTQVTRSFPFGHHTYHGIRYCDQCLISRAHIIRVTPYGVHSQDSHLAFCLSRCNLIYEPELHAAIASSQVSQMNTDNHLQTQIQGRRILRSTNYAATEIVTMFQSCNADDATKHEQHGQLCQLAYSWGKLSSSGCVWINDWLRCWRASTAAAGLGPPNTGCIY